MKHHRTEQKRDHGNLLIFQEVRIRARDELTMGLANNIIAALNFAAILCSIPIIASGIWLASKPDNHCIHYVRWPLIILGIAILLVSLTGFVGAYWYNEALLAIYLFIMAILIVALLVLTVFAFVVTRPDGGHSVVSRGYKEYNLDGFSSWLRSNVVNHKNWGKIKSCLIQSDICSKLADEYLSPDQFFASNTISPLQSGCCKPLTICEFTYTNPTLWINPANQAADSDCYLWSNDPTQFCYNCRSCKAGLLGNLRKEWRKANLILIVSVVALIWIYLIACCAFKNAQTEDLFRRYKEDWI